jgi:acyl carrier protein
MNQQLIEALSNYCDPGIEITRETELISDLGMTSFDLIQAMGDFEESTGHSIDMENLAGVTTVGQLDAAVARALNAM